MCFVRIVGYSGCVGDCTIRVCFFCTFTGAGLPFLDMLFLLLRSRSFHHQIHVERTRSGLHIEV